MNTDPTNPDKDLGHFTWSEKWHTLKWLGAKTLIKACGVCFLSGLSIPLSIVSERPLNADSWNILQFVLRLFSAPIGMAALFSLVPAVYYCYSTFKKKMPWPEFKASQRSYALAVTVLPPYALGISLGFYLFV